MLNCCNATVHIAAHRVIRETLCHSTAHHYYNSTNTTATATTVATITTTDNIPTWTVQAVVNAVGRWPPRRRPSSVQTAKCVPICTQAEQFLLVDTSPGAVVQTLGGHGPDDSLQCAG
eukprot:778-Heterococcus_DN1.PRE.4